MNAPGTTPETSDVEVSIIVVTHGAREMTLACLKSVAAEADSFPSEIIVVDNASRDALAAQMASLYPEFHVLPQITNLGFAAAANLGADHARGRYLLFLNPDTVLPGGVVARLLECARGNSGAGLWGVRTYFANGEENPTCCRRRPTLWRLLCSGLGFDTRFAGSALFSGMAYTELGSSGDRTVDVICGACLLVGRTVWDRLGGFSPAFFMYGEDDDFSLRAGQIGHSPRLALDLGIVHHGSGTEPEQEKKLCQIFAARSLTIRGHFAAPSRHIARALLLLRPFLGKYFSEQELRPLWQAVWATRRRWLSGRFA
jgi:GT2 family glycosyltransferase